MAQPMSIGMPQSVDLGAGYSLQVTALDPSTGATVAGVNVTTVVIEADTFGGDISGLPVGNWFLVPGPNA